MAGKRFARILLLRATEQISAEKTISKKKSYQTIASLCLSYDMTIYHRSLYLRLT